MPDELISKILDDVADIHDRPAWEVNLSRVNEPFLRVELHHSSAPFLNVLLIL
jgi:hypothetical protein